MKKYSRLVFVLLVILSCSSTAMAERSSEARKVLNFIEFNRKWLKPFVEGGSYNYESFNVMYEWAQRSFKAIPDKDERQEIIDSLLVFPIVNETALADRVIGMSFAMKEFPEVHKFIEENLDHSNEEVVEKAIRAFVKNGYYKEVEQKIQEYKCYLILQTYPTEEARSMLENAVQSEVGVSASYASYALAALEKYSAMAISVRNILSSRIFNNDNDTSVAIQSSIKYAAKNNMVDQVSNIGFYSADTSKAVRIIAVDVLGLFAKDGVQSAITELERIVTEHDDASIRGLAQSYIDRASE